MRPAHPDPNELLLNRTWRTTLSYIGMDGMPSCQTAGNVLRPYTHLKLSFRLPPTLSAQQAKACILETLTKDPPYGAQIAFDVEDAADGWEARAFTPEIERTIREASLAAFGKKPMAMGLGGSIPFLAHFGKAFPAAKCIVTGALGPKSNAHGPNECLNIPFTKQLTLWLAHVLARRRS